MKVEFTESIKWPEAIADDRRSLEETQLFFNISYSQSKSSIEELKSLGLLAVDMTWQLVNANDDGTLEF